MAGAIHIEWRRQSINCARSGPVSGPSSLTHNNTYRVPPFPHEYRRGRKAVGTALSLTVHVSCLRRLI